jgi:K+/H+ antiporter YhaU regulatory subunit KhtT
VLFRDKAPRSLAGLTLVQSGIRQDTGCSVVAIRSEGKLTINPDPFEIIRKGSEMIVIGTYENERKFLRTSPKK